MNKLSYTRCNMRIVARPTSNSLWSAMTILENKFD